jgi:enediyne biosynthesis protein E4
MITSRRMRVILAVAVILACIGLAVGLAGRDRGRAPPPATPSGAKAAVATGLGNAADDTVRRPGFLAATRAVGIDFQMNFLPDESGENFRINLYDHGAGVAVADIDGDGDDDIYFCNQLGPNALFQNVGNGVFRDATAASGPVGLDDRICVAATFADYDNDGDQDLFVTSVRGGNTLLQNDGRGLFKDVTEQAGVAHIGHSQTGIYFDFDLDGDLDLLVTNTASWTTNEFNEKQRYYVGMAQDIFRSPKEFNILYRNEGDGTFVNVTQGSGLAGRGWGSDAVVLDYDEDGWFDVLITNMFGQAQLYRNETDGKFRDVTDATLRRTSYGSVGARAFDIHNDGRLDLYLADMHSDMWMSGSPLSPGDVEESRKYRYLQGPLVERSAQEAEIERLLADELNVDYDRLLFGNSFYNNIGGGRFEEVSDRIGAETFWPWGIAAGDFDNDGFQDAFIPSGMGHPFFYWRNYLLMNQGNGTFKDESASRGIEPRPGGQNLDDPIAGKPAVRSSRAAATADFDVDGRLDLIVNNFNEAPYYYRNEFPKRDYIQFRLRGTRSNRDAVGAVVRLHFAGDEVMIRQVESAAGYLSQSSKTLHFGLGSRRRVDHVEIVWPSGQKQVIESPVINTRHDIVEPESLDATSTTPTAD